MAKKDDSPFRRHKHVWVWKRRYYDLHDKPIDVYECECGATDERRA